MDIQWDAQTCRHAGECVRGLPSVFKIVQGKFVIDPQAAAPAEVRAVVARCQSGALRIVENAPHK